MPRRVTLMVLGILLCFAASFADETLTIVTYYPAPYGEYNELQTNKLALGSATSQPVRDGDITFALNGDHTFWAAGGEGELGYDRLAKKFYYYDGSTWKVLGG